MYPHRIHLRGPWEWESGSAQGTLTVPGALPAPRPLQLRRRFGWPGRLNAHERVWLTFAGLPARARISLNGEELSGIQGCGEADLTRLLRPRNELRIGLDVPAEGGEMGEVALEVRCTAWLRHVQLTHESQGTHIAGEVAGSSAEPLDLYLLMGRTTVGYASVIAGGRFALRANRSALEGPLRVELVNGGVVWYALDLAGDPATP
ncbi:MAG TPA: hypothetical protein VFA18_24880 [Gemmataceae bacterium]|nr:hypothetical protein [Gemmataceae bacterium]